MGPYHSQAAQDVLTERERQISAEGWAPEHDDEHSCGELADAAACYACPAPHGVRVTAQDDPPKHWPWHRSWWKPSTRRRNLVRAAALIIAEIERLDRASALRSQAASDGPGMFRVPRQKSVRLKCNRGAKMGAAPTPKETGNE